MGDVTQILKELQLDNAGRACEKLFPIVYEELKGLATFRLNRESPGQTLQPTALVNEAYLRLVDQPNWEHRGHFFVAAAKAMDRILVDQARRKNALKRGGDRNRIDAEVSQFASPVPDDVILTLHDALEALELVKPEAANLVRLRFFAAMTNKEAADALDISPRTANSLWTYARAWLYERIGETFHLS